MVALIVAVGVGFINGYVVVRTRIPSFLVTLGTFLMLQGLNLAVTKGVTGAVASQDVSQMTGFSSAATIFASSINVLSTVASSSAQHIRPAAGVAEVKSL